MASCCHKPLRARSSLVSDLKRLGVESGQMVMVHSYAIDIMCAWAEGPPAQH